MKIVLLSWMFASAMLAGVCRAAPEGSPLFTDEKSERDSVNGNEVAPPDENWKLFSRLTKSMSSLDRSDAEKTRALRKEIEEFSRLVVTLPAAVTDDDDDTAATATATSRPTDDDVNATGSASSDFVRFAPDWKNDAVAEDQNDGNNVEDIIRKMTADLKKLYGKIKEVISVVKNWIKSTRGQMKEYDGPLPMSTSASESDGVFVIAEPLIGDVDKSNKYTVPIFAD